MDIRGFRKKYNLSREDLASKVGVSYMTIYRWETKPPKRQNKVIKEKLERIVRGYEQGSKGE
jgi:DNA-binding XRE family transcriptional regulator